MTTNTSVRERVLDLAAGSGAWLARLNDVGFNHFTAVELDTERFEFKQVTPLPFNLNSNFSQKLDSSDFNLMVLPNLSCKKQKINGKINNSIKAEYHLKIL